MRVFLRGMNSYFLVHHGVHALPLASWILAPLSVNHSEPRET